MYYSWVIRHMPDNRYSDPEFKDEHKWIMQADSQYWRPQD
jgi:5-deoxy-glucuronate isomerase